VDLASPFVLRSGVQHSCVVEQCSELTSQVQEESAVVFQWNGSEQEQIDVKT
jgi:hypothetical protein